MSEPFPIVKGYCPMGCGKTLFLGAGGHVTCSFVECPNPSSVDFVLSVDKRALKAQEITPSPEEGKQ